MGETSPFVLIDAGSKLHQADVNRMLELEKSQPLNDDETSVVGDGTLCSDAALRTGLTHPNTEVRELTNRILAIRAERRLKQNDGSTSRPMSRPTGELKTT